VSESSQDRRGARDADERAADHAAIDRLAVELLPALVAKLGATGLGELEVREGGWRVRLRRPIEAVSGGAAASVRARRSAERGPGSGSDRPERADRPERPGERPLRSAHHSLEVITARTESRAVATSPAVGIYRPRTDLTVGDRVRAGDRLGAVDMLGVAQEVVAPMDGIVGASLVESGDAVEYGQELLAIEIIAAAGTSTNGTT
jgi:biotin carboxyl carrier protein